MAPIAALMTGRGAGAIATIQLVGDSGETVLREIFRQADDRPLEFTVGRVLLGNIVEGEQTIDQVTVGCEDGGAFAIHCHGNPLIVEKIMGLLQRQGVQPVRAEHLLGRVLMSREPSNSISVEAKLALTTVKTIEGAAIIANQVKTGLAGVARRWLDGLDSIGLDQIAADAKRILKDSETARLILSGCTIAVVGPPNTGKSTLLNALAGREKAIVTDIPGTTRDWVSAEIRIPPLSATIIDTAGFDPAPATAGSVDQAAQHKGIEALNRADLVLLMLDASQPADQLRTCEDIGHRGHRDPRAGKRTVVVLNKTDLPPRLDISALPEYLRQAVHISAKQETGIEDLIHAVHQTCGVADLSLRAVVAFTERQRNLIDQLTEVKVRDETIHVVAELLHGPLSAPE